MICCEIEWLRPWWYVTLFACGLEWKSVDLRLLTRFIIAISWCRVGQICHSDLHSPSLIGPPISKGEYCPNPSPQLNPNLFIFSARPICQNQLKNCVSFWIWKEYAKVYPWPNLVAWLIPFIRLILIGKDTQHSHSGSICIYFSTLLNPFFFLCPCSSPAKLHHCTNMDPPCPQGKWGFGR